MAFTLTDLKVEKVGWVENIQGDISATETIKAAVSTASHYVESITINCATAQTVTVGTDEVANGITAPFIGPIVFTTVADNFEITFTRPLKCGANKALLIDAGGADVVNAVVTGYTK